MIDDREIWRAAQAMVKRYSADAGFEAAQRADQLLADGDPEGCATWHRILEAIERLQTTKPAAGEGVH